MGQTAQRAESKKKLELKLKLFFIALLLLFRKFAHFPSPISNHQSRITSYIPAITRNSSIIRPANPSASSCVGASV